MKPHSFTFSRFTTRKTTNHTRNLRQTTPTVRGGLGMRWLRGRGISLRYPFWEDIFFFCYLLIGELDPMSTDKPLLLFACCVLGQNALLSQSALLCTLPVEYEPVMILRARTCHVLELCRRLCWNCGNAKMWNFASLGRISNTLREGGVKNGALCTEATTVQSKRSFGW